MWHVFVQRLESALTLYLWKIHWHAAFDLPPSLPPPPSLPIPQMVAGEAADVYWSFSTWTGIRTRWVSCTRLYMNLFRWQNCGSGAQHGPTVITENLFMSPFPPLSFLLSVVLSCNEMIKMCPKYFVFCIRVKFTSHWRDFFIISIKTVEMSWRFLHFLFCVKLQM